MQTKTWTRFHLNHGSPWSLYSVSHSVRDEPAIFCTSNSVQEDNNTWVQEYNNTILQEYKKKTVQDYKSSRVH